MANRLRVLRDLAMLNESIGLFFSAGKTRRISANNGFVYVRRGWRGEKKHTYPYNASWREEG